MLDRNVVVVLCVSLVLIAFISGCTAQEAAEGQQTSKPDEEVPNVQDAIATSSSPQEELPPAPPAE